MPFSPNDIRRVGEILAFAARTEIMPRFRRLTPTQVREKSSPLDLVTEADEVAEAVITTGLKMAFPGAIDPVCRDWAYKTWFPVAAESGHDRVAVAPERRPASREGHIQSRGVNERQYQK